MSGREQQQDPVSNQHHSVLPSPWQLAHLSPPFSFPSERSRLVCNSSWQALQLWAAFAFLQRTSSRRRGRNCHVCWLVIRSQSHPESWGLKLNYTLLVPIKQCTPSLAFYLKYNPIPWTLSRLSEWWHLTTSHTQCQIAMTFTGNVKKGTANYYYSTHCKTAHFDITYKIAGQ